MNQTLYVLQTYFRISLWPIFHLLLLSYKLLYMFHSFTLVCNFSAHTQIPQIFIKNTPKSCILMAVGTFFSLQHACPKDPRTSFPFYKFFYPTISSLLKSLIKCTATRILNDITYEPKKKYISRLSHPYLNE